MWDYSAFPVWALDGGAMLSSGDLPISDELRTALQAWCDDVDRAMWGPSGPDAADNVLPSGDTITAFDARGRALSERLQTELGPAFSVDYWPV